MVPYLGKDLTCHPLCGSKLPLCRYTASPQNSLFGGQATSPANALTISALARHLIPKARHEPVRRNHIRRCDRRLPDRRPIGHLPVSTDFTAAETLALQQQLR